MHIELWYDDDSLNDPVWIVSLCDQGNELRVLSDHEEYDEALEAAEREAASRNLPLYEVDEYGIRTLIE